MDVPGRAGESGAGRRGRHAGWAVCLALAASGCSCGPSAGRIECGAFVPVLDAWCAALDRCPLVLPLAGPDRAACVDLGCTVFTCRIHHDDARGEHRDTVGQQLPTRDAERVQACAAWLTTASCDALENFNPPQLTPRRVRRSLPGPTPCDGLLTPNEPAAFGAGAGAQCTVDTCAPGLYCADPTVIRTSALRRCQACRPLPAEGESCTSAGTCAAGLVCQTRVTATTCVPPFKDGEACTLAQQCASGSCDLVSNQCAPKKADGQSCQRADECRSNLCDLGRTRTCLPGCQSDADCGPGTWCDATTSLCHPGLAAGDRCEGHGQCADGFCRTEGRCGARPVPGDTCSTALDCAPESFCSGGACVALKRLGEVCTAADACRVGLECRGGACQRLNLACAPGKAGEGCLALRQCDDQTFCDEASLSCQPKKPLGANCGQPAECLSGLTCPGFDGGACAAPFALGAACALSTDCAPDLRCEPDPLTLARSCVSLPTGQPCAANAACPATHFCAATGRCAPRAAEGQGCSVNALCLDALYCEQGTACRPRRSEGETCGPFVTCKAGLRCSTGGVCEPAASVGGACDAQSASPTCAAGLYCDGLQSPAACAAQLGTGQSCTRDAQCPGGACEPSFGCLESAACVLVP